MSRQPLPEYLEPARLAEQGRVLEGVIANSAMRRLVECLASPAGETRAHLEFEVDSGRRKLVRGWARTEVELTCQRCLEPFSVPLVAEFTLAVVESEEQGERLPDEYEPLIDEGRPVRTAELIEDELILALPIVALHAAGDPACPAPKGAAGDNAPAGGEGRGGPNPFDVLEQLKKRER